LRRKGFFSKPLRPATVEPLRVRSTLAFSRKVRNMTGLIDNAFTTFPAFVLLSGVIYLARKGFFGPRQ
jgi:hypothetical protein